MLIVIFTSVWFVIGVAAAVIAYASRTGPDEAIKNLSQWLERGGFKDTQGWISEQWKKRKLRVLGVSALLGLLVVGIFTAGMVVEKELSGDRGSISARPANHWNPLSDQETIALRDELRKLAPERLNVLCAIPACADLAESIFDLTQSMQWSGTYASAYFMDNGIQQGIEIWSYAGKEKERDGIAAALERATNGRLKISSHLWPGEPSPENRNDINFVVGRFK
jgi:hypothetical protein